MIVRLKNVDKIDDISKDRSIELEFNNPEEVDEFTKYYGFDIKMFVENIAKEVDGVEIDNG